MDVLVCAAQVPFMRGGLESLVERLIEALERAGHSAEAVRIPTAWDRGRVLDAPAAARLLPLGADLVIPVNFPAYYVRHPRKVVWLAHQQRSAYDGIGQPWSDFGLDDESLETQRLLTQWDIEALDEASAIFTISKLVGDRLRNFCGLESEVLYHPPPLAPMLKASPPGDRIVAISRLEQNKRPGLLIEALKLSKRNLSAVLAGIGSLESELRDSGASLLESGRLEMPGYMSDEQSAALYSEALAVVYAPFEEDYGYVSLEAFLAGKPVVTTKDSGGVLEWVVDGESGLVVEPEAGAIAEALDRLDIDRQLAAKLGAEGRRRAEVLAWDVVVERLVNAPS